MDVLQQVSYAIVLPCPLGVMADRVAVIAPLQCLADGRGKAWSAPAVAADR